MRSTRDRVLERLEALGFKRKRNGEWVGNCPWKPSSDSQSFNVRFTDGEHGTWTYFAGGNGGGEHGSLYELATRLGIDLPKDGRVDVSSTKTGYSGLDEYAKRHFVPAEAYERASWSETMYRDRPALMWPVNTGTRLRFIDEKGGFLWVGENGGNCWYGLDRAIDMANHRALPLILCNGEPSTVAAQWRGIPAFCGTGGEGAINEAMISELNHKWEGEIIIALDSDEKGEYANQKMLDVLGRGVAIDLGLSEKGDLADFCELHGDDAMAALRRLSLPEKRNDIQEMSNLIEFVSQDAMLAQFNQMIYSDPSLFGRTIEMPFAGLRSHGGFAETMTTKKVWIIGNVSGGGKTIWSECLSDEFNRSGHNVFYIGDEWSPMDLVARSIQRAYPGNDIVTYKQILDYVGGKADISNNQRNNLALAQRKIRSRPGKTYYMQVSENAVENGADGMIYLEDILQSALTKIRNLKANGIRIDVVILDYLSLYETRATANNPEEYKVGVFKSYCKTLDVLGISTSQVKKEAEDRTKRTGGFLTAHDLYWVRPDKANLITTMNRIYMNNYSANQGRDMSVDEAKKIYHDENDQPVATPNFALQTVKNSVGRPGQYSFFHFDFDRLCIIEGLHPDWYWDDDWECVMHRGATAKGRYA